MSVSAVATPASLPVPASVNDRQAAGGDKKVTPGSGGATDTSKSQEQAALNQLLAKYTNMQAHGADARALSALGKQITAEAKVLGQHVTLPKAPATSSSGVSAGAASVNQGPAPAAKTAAPGKVDVTA